MELKIALKRFLKKENPDTIAKLYTLVLADCDSDDNSETETEDNSETSNSSSDSEEEYESPKKVKQFKKIKEEKKNSSEKKEDDPEMTSLMTRFEKLALMMISQKMNNSANVSKPF